MDEHIDGREQLEEQEPYYSPYKRVREPIPVCKCLRDDESSEKVEIPARKLHILTTVSRTESYLRERRIPELIRFLLTKVIAESSSKPIAYLEKLLSDCMLFRAGHSTAPVLYEDRHIDAIIQSFDPGKRGWLSAGQLRRAYITMGLQPENYFADTIPIETAFNHLKEAQATELHNLLSAGLQVNDGENNGSSDISSFK